MPVESFIDLLTYTFQATVFVTLTVGLGYVITGRSDRDVAKVRLATIFVSSPSIGRAHDSTPEIFIDATMAR